jgi:hypothetical protein
MRLEDKVIFTNKTRPVCLPTTNDNLGHLNQEGIVIGWVIINKMYKF